MATRIRLQRHGKKGKPFFHLVAADSRAKRDGKFIEKLGTYNPTANPAVIDINFERTLSWVQTGAEMSDTARAILSYKGVLYKSHLINGVKKGALTMEQVEERFTLWVNEKESKIINKIDGLAAKAIASKNAKMKSEADANIAKAAQIELKNTVVEEVAAEETPAEETVTEEVAAEETPAEETVSEEVVAEETPAEDSVTEEVVAEETPAEETVTEELVAEETPAEETVTEEVFAEETPLEETVTEEVVAEETPAEETVTEEVVAEETPAEETPAEEKSADTAE
ncbi:MAG: 30S ribosomal protein S16 [Flavobacteriales bacterium]|nr:30S ribosomal protein S16 [Flavobacteriales bacterium]